MRYVFIIPKYDRQSNEGYYMPPLGIGYIIAILKKSGREVICFNFNENDQIDKTLPPSKRQAVFHAQFNKETDIILTGGLSVHYVAISNIVRNATIQGIRTIIGGGLLTAEPEFIYDIINPTYGVIGEGEQTILELATVLENNTSMATDTALSQVKGIIYKKDGVTTITEPRESIRNLDALPYPEYDLIGLPEVLARMKPTDEPYFQSTDTPRMIGMVTSRSCPYDCSFCFHPLGRGYRKRSMDSIFGEIQFVMDKYHPNILLFVDELIGEDKERLAEFCERIKKHKIAWLCQMRVSSVDADTLAKMKDSGCVAISYGIESINDAVLKEMNKHTTRAQIENALELTYQAGIGIQGNLIFGTSGETLETAAESIDWWMNHQRYMLNLMAVYSYPGSALYKLACEKGIIPSKETFMINKCPPVNVAKMNDVEYTKMMNEVRSQHLKGSSEFNASKSVEQEIEGPDTMIVRFACAHCGHQNEFHNMPRRGDPYGRPNLRYACRKCNQRNDMEFKKL